MGLKNYLTILLFSFKEGLKSFARSSRKHITSNWFTPTPTPQRLLLAPYNLKTADQFTAIDIYEGRYFLAGKLVDLADKIPFEHLDGTDAWQTELHSFNWLRHLSAGNEPRTKTRANELISQWTARNSNPNNNLAWRLDITSHRVISWLYSSVQIVENSDTHFYRMWMKSFGVHIKYLKQSCNHEPIGMPRLLGRIALAYASICISDQKTYLRNADTLLDEELAAQILTDGGHITRNPAIIPEILGYLLPLRESYAKLGKAPSQELVSAIDRLMAALKFYRLGDGSIVHFNSASISKMDLITAILRYDDARGTAADNASFSNYQRITRGNAVLICDTGTNPKSTLSKTSHAGTLSFEFSAGLTPILLNCGVPENCNAELRQAVRYTAAHNALVMNDKSSSLFYNGHVKNLIRKVISGPEKVACVREENEKFTTINTSHDGYLSRFGAIHHRMLGLDKSGSKLIGEDKILNPQGQPLTGNSPSKFSIHFHLNPSLSAGKSEDGRSIIIMGGNGIAWKFTCIDILPSIEESVFFAAQNGPRKTKQIVLYGDAKKDSTIRWIFEKQLQEK